MEKQFSYYVWLDPEIEDIIALEKKYFTEKLKNKLKKENILVKQIVASSSVTAAKKVYKDNPFL